MAETRSNYWGFLFPACVVKFLFAPQMEIHLPTALLSPVTRYISTEMAKFCNVSLEKFMCSAPISIFGIFRHYFLAFAISFLSIFNFPASSKMTGDD